MRLPFEVWANTETYGKTCVGKFLVRAQAEAFISLLMPKPEICEILDRDEINAQAQKERLCSYYNL